MNLLDYVGKFLVRPAAGIVEPCRVASLAVLETLLQACRSGLVPDVRRIKENYFRRMEARTKGEQAKAAKLVAEAARESNEVTSKAYQKALQNAELRRLAIERVKGAAEATRQMYELFKEMKETELAAAQIKFIEALVKLSREGGALHADSDNLKMLLELAQNGAGTTESPKPPSPKAKTKRGVR